MKNTVSKFAPKDGFPDLPSIKGLKVSTINASISKGNKPDLLLIEASKGSTIAGLFTKSETCSAAVDWSRQTLGKSQNAQFPIEIIVNSGNANVFTGSYGVTTVKETVSSVAHRLNTSQDNIFVASTGVIGEYLDFKKITSKIEKLRENLKPDSFLNAAKAIMTTDTFPKGSSIECHLESTPIKISGIAKGSGMIAPNMATMLVFIFSDISIEKSILQEIIRKCNKKSFDRITVDSDTSTSDSLFVIATGTAKMPKIKSIKDSRVLKFQKHLQQLMLELAHLVIKDGEGITKFVEIVIKGAKSNKKALRLGKSIAESPLVKTAFAGEDPNWGRIIMAIGKAGVRINKEKISIFFGDHAIAENGSISRYFSEYAVSKYMKNDSLVVTVDLAEGSKKASIYTCDLTHGYISINADYRS